MGRALAAMDVHVDMIISSPLKRATQTASLVGNELSYEGKLQLEDALRPASPFAEFRKMLDKYAKHEAIMVVGHNPNLSEFAGRCISEPGCEAAVELKKGAVREGRNGAQLGGAAVVYYSENRAHALHGCSGQFAAEDFAEIASSLFHRPQLQVYIAALLGEYANVDLTVPHADPRLAHRTAPSQIESARQAKKQRRFADRGPLLVGKHLHRRVIWPWGGICPDSAQWPR